MTLSAAATAIWRSWSPDRIYRDIITVSVISDCKKARRPRESQGDGLFSFVRCIDQRTHQHEQVASYIYGRLLGSSGALLVNRKGGINLTVGGNPGGNSLFIFVKQLKIALLRYFYVLTLFVRVRILHPLPGREVLPQKTFRLFHCCFRVFRHTTLLRFLIMPMVKKRLAVFRQKTLTAFC